MKWSDITLGKYQDIHRISQDNSLDETDKSVRIIATLHDMTEKEVSELKLIEYNRLKMDVETLLDSPIPGKPERTIRAKRKYGIIYDIKKLKHRQYVEIIHFAEDPIKNMHLLMASIVQPIRFGIWRDNRTEDHEKISNDMLDARLMDVYHTCVFFCKLYANSITVIRAYLVKEMTSKGMTTEQAENMILTSLASISGCIPPKGLQSTKG